MKGTRVAKFYFRYRAMNSDKLMALLQAAYNYEEWGQRTLFAKPVADTKGDTVTVSRLGVSRNVDLLVDRKTNLRKLLGPFIAEAEAQGEEPVARLLIGEAQFLSPVQVDDLLRIVVELAIPVIAHGIRTDFLTHSFPSSRRLLKVAHSLEELETTYRYGKKAVLDGYTVGGALVLSGGQVAVDGVKVDYEALCPTCYFEVGGLPPYETERCHGGAY